MDGRPCGYGALVAGAALGFAVVNLVPVATPEHPAFIFLCGTIAISAMLLPGISGSFILLILGKYAYVLGALGKLDLGVILPFVAGCAVGILVFSRLLKWLLDRWHDTVLAGLIGLLIGSLWRIWPYQTLETVVVREKPRVIGATPFFPEAIDIPTRSGVCRRCGVRGGARDLRRAPQDRAVARETAEARERMKGWPRAGTENRFPCQRSGRWRKL